MLTVCRQPVEVTPSTQVTRYGVERSRRRRQTLRVRINSRRCGEGPGEWRNVGHKEVPCDPSTKNDAGRTPATQSVQAYRGMLPAGRGGVRSLLQAPPRPVGPEQIRQYQAHLFTDRKLDANTVAQHLSALRFFFVKTLKRNWSVQETPYPKRPIRLPDVLSREEVQRLIESADNPLHASGC